MTPTLDDNLQTLRDLFPHWEATAAELRLWATRLRNHDQNRVRRAIESMYADIGGNRRSPDLGKVTSQFAQVQRDEQAGEYDHAKWLAYLPADEARAYSHYERIWLICTPDQQAKILRVFGRFDELARRDPLEVKHRVTMLDRELPTQRAALMHWMAEDAKPMPLEQQKSAMRALTSAIRKVGAHYRKTRTVREIAEILYRADKRAKQQEAVTQ